MKPEDFDLFASIVKQRSGLVLTNDRAYLLESRLPPVARKWGFKTIDDLAHAIRDRRVEAMMSAVTEAMTSNESSFFRDHRPFEHFRKTILPSLLQKRSTKKHIRIWSAGASSGQEAYSLAMICAEEADRLRGWKIDIVGTDLSHEMVERAQAGVYTHLEAQRGLPITMLVKYFQQISDKWQIKDHVRHMIQFRTGNLVQDFGPVGVYDVIFCRNVLPGFDVPTKRRVLDSLSGVLAADGTLFLGRAESVLGFSEKFKSMENERGIYVRVPPGEFSTARQTA